MIRYETLIVSKGAQVAACSRCGAIVIDADRHSRHHRRWWIRLNMIGRWLR